MWVKQEEDKRLPEWLGKNLSSTCKYCGSPMMNYYNDEDGRCTSRRCSNEYCPGMLAARADNMRQLIGLKGVGFAACLADIKAYNIKNPIQLLKYWKVKPRVELGTYLRMQCWEGVDSGLEKEMKVNNIQTLDDLFTRYGGKYSYIIGQHKDELYEYADLVELPNVKSTAPPKIVHTIMITGTPIGFTTKEQFINSINEACSGKIVTVHQATKRQSGVDYLIREPGSTTRGKVEAAIKGGIPIVTSQEYMNILFEEISKM